MKVNMNVELDTKSDTTKAQLLKSMETIPDDAKMTVYVNQGDRPWESDTYTLKFSWTEER